MESLLSVGRAAELAGVHPVTIRRWTDVGGLRSSRSKAGQRRILIGDLEEFIGRKLIMDNRRQAVWGYARSSSGSDVSIASQVELIKRRFPFVENVVSDKASGLSEKRKGLMKLTRNAKAGEFSILVVTNKDRLTRFGFSYLEELFGSYGVEVVVLNSTRDMSPHEELMSDFMSLLASFSGKFYRIRGWEQQRKLLSEAGEKIGDG